MTELSDVKVGCMVVMWCHVMQLHDASHRGVVFMSADSI